MTTQHEQGLIIPELVIELADKLFLRGGRWQRASLPASGVWPIIVGKPFSTRQVSAVPAAAFDFGSTLPEKCYTINIRSLRTHLMICLSSAASAFQTNLP